MKIFKSTVGKHFPEGSTLGEVLIKMSKLEPKIINDAAQKGAVWVQVLSKGKTLRLRNTNAKLNAKDTVSFFYDPNVLSIKPPTGIECIEENANYGVWLKPAGVVPQGTQTGDHASLLRFVEIKKKKEAFLVHRLDRETEGLMIIAYNSKAAGLLGDLFQKNEIKKTYEAVVYGEMRIGHKETINVTLDDKEAVTHIEVIDNRGLRTLLKVEIETGRLHQIRRHLDFIGHPVMGDPKYGKGNKNREGLKLLAYSLSFKDPWEFKLMSWSCPQHLSL